MKNNYINFVLTGDNNYVAPLGVCITSILLNLADDKFARFYLFVEDFTDDDIKSMEEVKKVRPCEIIFVNMKDYAHLFSAIDTKKFVLKYVNLVVYYRLLMLDILPDDVEKCFYIDGDMIIDSDLSNLYDNFNDRNIIGAVVEVLAMQNRNNILKHFMEWEELSNFHNDPLKFPYFNAGFFLLNVKKAKELNLFKQAFDFLEKHPNPPYADQDTLNYIIGQKSPQLVEHFPPSYNVFCDMHHDIELYYDAFYDMKDIQDAFSCPKIYHYGGPNKPWINRNVKFFYSIWWRYCHLSPWYNMLQPAENNEYTNGNQTNFNNSIQFNKKKLVYKLFNIIPIFKKLVKYSEKKYYFLGIRIFTKTQINIYKKTYRLFGLKFSKLNFEKMFDSKIESLKNLVNNSVTQVETNFKNRLEQFQINLDANSNDYLKKLQINYETNSNNQLKQSQRNIKELFISSSNDLGNNLTYELYNLKKRVEVINSVYATHQNSFLSFKNSLEGKDIVIVATGSSLNHYIPIPNAIHIGVNNAYKFEKIMLDFLFIQDISDLKEEIFNINQYGLGKCQKFYGNVLSFETCAKPESYLIKYNAKRYYTGGMFTPFATDISSCLLPDFGSVVFASLAFALYTNPSRIYLVGCDYSDTGYFDSNEKEISKSLKGDLPYILDGWHNFKTFATHHYPETKIISINPVGLKGLFPEIEMR